MDADLPHESDRADLRRLAEAAATDPWGRAPGALLSTNFSRLHTADNLAARVVKLVDALDAAEAAVAAQAERYDAALAYQLKRGDAAEARASAATAEAAALRAALRDMLSWAIPGMNWTDEIGQELLANARAALATPGPGAALLERVKRLEAALELFRSEYCVYDGTDREPNLGMVAAAVHAALAGEKTP